MQINRNEHGEERSDGHFGGQWNFVVGHFQTARLIVKAIVFVKDYLIVHEWIYLLETKPRCVFGTSRPMSYRPVQNEPLFNRPAVTRHERTLPHDNHRRAHYDFRGTHYEWWRSHKNFVMTFVS